MRMSMRIVGLLMAITMLFSVAPPQTFPAFAGDTALACESAPAILARTPLNTKICNNSTWDCMIIVECSGSDLNQPTALKDGAPMQWPTNGVFEASGVYTINVTNKSGASASLTFTIARSDMKLTVTDSQGNAVPCGKEVAGDVKVAYSGTNINPPVIKKDCQYVTLPADGKFTANGQYVITLTNKTGGVIVFYFFIKRPSDIGIKISAKTADGDCVKDDGVVEEDVIVSYSGTDLEPVAVTKDGKDYLWPDGGKFTENGTYIVTVTDTHENGREFSFTISKPAVLITAVNPYGKEICDGKKVDCAVTVKYSGIGTLTVPATKDGTTMAWPEGGKFTGNGKYVITLSNNTGDSTDFTFTINRCDGVVAARTVTKSKLLNGGFSQNNVKVTLGAGKTVKSLTLNGKAIRYPASGVFNLQGTYVLTVADGTATVTFTFTIDKTKPVILARSGKLVREGQSVRSNVSVAVSDANLLAVKVWKNGKLISLPDSKVLTESGKYIITAVDKAGNTRTVHFKIVKPKK